MRLNPQQQREAEARIADTQPRTKPARVRRQDKYKALAPIGAVLRTEMPELIEPNAVPFGHRIHTELGAGHVTKLLDQLLQAERNPDRYVAKRLLGHIVGLHLALIQGKLALSDLGARAVGKAINTPLTQDDALDILLMRLRSTYELLEPLA
jgi:hypothetical protein